MQSLHDAVTIPSEAVQFDSRGAYVYLVKQVERAGAPSDVAIMREVTPGIEAGRITVIEKGVVPEDMVVVEDALYCDGHHVTRNPPLGG